MSAAVAVAPPAPPPEEEEPSRYEFDAEFQSKIVAMMLRDTTFMERTDGLIQPDYMEAEGDAAIARVALDFFRRFKKTPDRSSIGLVLKNAFESKLIPKTLLDDVRDRTRQALTADISDRDLVTEEIGTFARARACEAAMMKGIKLLEARKFDDIAKVMQEAVQVGVRAEGQTYDYWAENENRRLHREAVKAGLIKPSGIGTGYPELDKYLYEAGWGRKELSVIMGAAKAGKSMSLGDFGKNASLLGYNVLYVTLEVSAKIIADRIDANISDTAMGALKDDPVEVARKVAAAEARAGIFQMAEYASGTFKVSGLRRLLQDFRNRGVIFDLVIVDYADIMAPERFTGELRDDMRQIYIDLRGVAFEWNCAVLTATQTNRDGAKAAVAKMTDIAEDFNKVRTADILISINATAEERAVGEARLFFAATRNGEGEFTLRVKQDRSKMKFIKSIVGRE